MDQVKLDKFKELLLEKRKEIIEDLMISNDNFSNMDHVKVGDLVDQATNFYEKELLIGLSTTEKESLKEIDLALKKIEDKTYGQCDSCGAVIDEKRLEAIPYAPLCMDCKSKGAKKKSKLRTNS